MTCQPTPVLSPSARRLLTVLTSMSPAQRAAATNRQLAELIGTSTVHPRTVSTALEALDRAGLITVVRTKPDPSMHPTGRHIRLAAEALAVTR